MSYADSHMPTRQQSDPQRVQQQFYTPQPDTRLGQPSRYSPRIPPAQSGYHTPGYEYDQSPYYDQTFATFTPESYPQHPRRRPQPYARTPSLQQQHQQQQQQQALESPMMNFPMDLECDPSLYPSPPEEQEKPPPRPPNAWILYRSDRLRDIAEGVTLPGLETIKAELGMSADSGEKSLESGTEDAEGAGAGAAADEKPKKKAKPKKGSKTPSEGILNLGKGKTGRGIPQADISKLISMMWARESETVKKEYDGMATRKKEEHALKYPDYKFQPQRRVDKIRLREERERQKQAAKRAKDEAKQEAKPKRRGKSKPPPTSPYSTRPGRQLSGSDHGDHVVDWNKSQFLMNPFPFQGDAIPSMHGTLPPPHRVEQPIQVAAPAAPPPHVLPSSYDQYGSYMPEIYVPGYGNAFAEAYVFEPLPLPGDDSFSFNDFTTFPEGGMPDAESLAAIWCSIEEDVPNSANTEQFDIDSASSSNGPIDWNISAEQAINEWSTLGQDMSGSVGQPTVADWTSTSYDPGFNFISVPYGNESQAGPSSGSRAYHQQQPLPRTPVSAPLMSSTSQSHSHDTQPNISQSVFLSTSQPLSPVESTWSDARITSFSSAGATLGSAMHLPQPVRYVSSSAFPDTPLSVDTAGWTERTTSFSAMPPITDFGGEDSESLFDDEPEDRTSKSGYSSVDRIVITPGNHSPSWGQPAPLSAGSVGGFSDFSRRGSGVSAHSWTGPHSASVPAKSYVPQSPPVQRIASTGSVPIAPSAQAANASRSSAPSPLPLQDGPAPGSVPPVYVPHVPRGVRKARVVGHVYDHKASPASAPIPYSPPSHPT